MRIWVTLHKNHKIIARADAKSAKEDAAFALMDCLEQVYKRLDLAEPVWVSKHAKELSTFGRTKFFPSDFLEPVKFDWMEIEYISETQK